MEIYEGFMLIHGGGIWSVKGCVHPEGYAVALPRYFNGRKLKTLSDGMRLVRERFPSYLSYVPDIGFEVPLVPLEESEILNPYLKREVQDERVTNFMSWFKEIGLTGSWLYLGRGDDLDLLSSNLENYRILKELRLRGITHSLKTINHSEVETLNTDNFSFLKSIRVLEGSYFGLPYTFKIVECEQFGKVLHKERFVGTVEIERGLKPFSLPVKYEAGKFILTSFRTRFTELPEGTVLKVKGYLLHREDFLDLDLDLAEEVKILKPGKVEGVY
ncbi:hypothetical protein [Metallosphaera hakonensis]|uniref:Uncharacterized protein n=1 Tax=Metallosphaera hakonensis JCM 8857 = DSM 7519 TaxID=1293036 RepID=A0A2U9IT53_9CREN|nr:hypothetical protein DFR87_04885 [Metallosphaera hakonensis JCM 8857 = DSM 7519]